MESLKGDRERRLRQVKAWSAEIGEEVRIFEIQELELFLLFGRRLKAEIVAVR